MPRPIPTVALALCLMLAGCGGGGSTTDPFFDCDPLGSGVTVRNELLDVNQAPNTRHIVQLTIVETFLSSATYVLAVDIAPGESADFCAEQGIFYNLLVKYEDGTSGCVRFETSPLPCAQSGDGRSADFAINSGEMERFKVSYRGF